MGRHLNPRFGWVILVSGYCVLQLSIDHNIDVQYGCNISFAALPNQLESVRSNIGFPVVRTDGWAGERRLLVAKKVIVRFPYMSVLKENIHLTVKLSITIYCEV